MKSTFIYSYLTILSILVFACDAKLDLEPAQSISQSIALSTDENVQAVLNGAYDELGNFGLFGGVVPYSSELLAGDGEMIWAGFANPDSEIFLKQINTGNLRVRGIWQIAYRTINIANNILDAIEVVKEADRARVQGEALFIRAITYFELVRLFAKSYQAETTNRQLGVPLLLQPTKDSKEEVFVARSTVEEVYLQVLSDLQQAEQLLPLQNDWRASSYAASALLARVFIQMQDFEQALTKTERVIQSDQFQLLSDYADVFNREVNSTEDIFAIQNTVQDGSNSLNFIFATPEFNGLGSVEVLQQGHLDLYDPTDLRLKLFYPLRTASDTAWYCGKWNLQSGNIGLIRLSELLLVRAECNMRLNSEVGEAPLVDLNRIRSRAGLADKTQFNLEDILLERRLELAFEGQKLHDHKRLKKEVGRFEYDAPELILPIPQREIDLNPMLVQNEGY